MKIMHVMYINKIITIIQHYILVQHDKSTEDTAWYNNDARYSNSIEA